MGEENLSLMTLLFSLQMMKTRLVSHLYDLLLLADFSSKDKFCEAKDSDF